MTLTKSQNVLNRNQLYCYDVLLKPTLNLNNCQNSDRQGHEVDYFYISIDEDLEL